MGPQGESEENLEMIQKIDASDGHNAGVTLKAFKQTWKHFIHKAVSAERA